jgi:histidyl-tRNA synthetase
MNSQFEILGIAPEKRLEVSGLIDRRSKMETAKWDAYAVEVGLTKKQLDGLKDLLGDFDLWKKSDALVRLFSALDALGVKEYVKFDPNIMRGLLYYTGTVFEAFETSGSLKRAILGGGRYDNLLSDVGGKPLPATGFAMGDVVIGIILRENGLLPEFAPSPARVLVTMFDESLQVKSYALANKLRTAGIDTMVYPEPAKLPKQFKFADKMKMRVALVLGPDEAVKGEVVVKDLSTGSQQNVGIDAALNVIKGLLK